LAQVCPRGRARRVPDRGFACGARIEGKVDESWRGLKGAAPEVALELLSSIDRGLPLESMHRHESPSRTTTPRTRA
jgi:hypothetical protein